MADSELGQSGRAVRIKRAGSAHSVAPINQRYVLLMNTRGDYLSVARGPDAARGRALTTTPHAGDDACWMLCTKHSGGHAAQTTPPTKKWMRKREAKVSRGKTPPSVSAQDAPAWSASIGEISFHSPSTGTVLQSSPAQASSSRASCSSDGLVSIPGVGEAVTLSTSTGSVDSDGGPANGSTTAIFRLVLGPDRLPSQYLSHMRETGYCAMPSLIAPAMLGELRRAYGLERIVPDQRQQKPAASAVASAVSVKVLAHPVVSWITHQYMKTSELRVGAGPSLVTLRPGQNADGRGGWHCDYPCVSSLLGLSSLNRCKTPSRVHCNTASYLSLVCPHRYAASHRFSNQYPYLPWGRFPDPDVEQPGTGSLGVLYNVCVDEFTRQNGATMFALGSASEGTAPPSEWEGLSMLEEVPAGGPSGTGVDRRAEQLVAPAGTVILYDCRTWHRQHANLSQQPRSSLLTIFTPRWILPAHGDQTAMLAAMLTAAGVTARETECLIHLLGDRNAAQENWAVVTPILPEENGSSCSGFDQKESLETVARSKTSKL